MDRPQIKFRLPHLLLWRKGWYRYSKTTPSMLKEIKKCLTLDGYLFAESTKDITSIVMGAFDDFCRDCEKLKLPRPGFQRMYTDTHDKFERNRWDFAKDIYYLDVDFEICMVLSILDYIAWYEYADLKVDKPVFNRDLYKFGLKYGGPAKEGMTYKEINRHVNSYKWK